MNNLKEYAKHYYNIGLNITVISKEIGQYNCYAKDLFKVPYSKWKHLHKSRQTMSEFNSLPWDLAVGVGSVTGYNDLTVIDIDKCTNITVIKKMLTTLGLPKDYEWLVQSGSQKGFHIIIKTPQLPELLLEDVVSTYSPNKLFENYFEKIELLWYTHIVLPPSKHSSGNTYSFYTGKIPTKSPLKVSTETLENFIEIFLNEDVEIRESYIEEEEEESLETKENSNKECVAINTRVVFNNIQEEIIKCINSAQEEILIAVAWFTDEVIISYLNQKLKQGVVVYIIFYDDHINDKKIFKELINNGAKIRCSKKLMHNKFAIIDKETVINGSYNWTNNANRNNHENIQITVGDKYLIENFIIEFNKLFRAFKVSEKYFKTDEELFNDYMNNKKYPYKYPCFIPLEHSYYNRTKDIIEYQKSFMIILNKNELKQWYIFNYSRKKEEGKDLRKEKDLILDIYGEIEEKNGFIYFTNHIEEIVLITKEHLCFVNKRGDINQKIKYKNKIYENLFFSKENGDNYICYIVSSQYHSSYPYKIEKHEIPNYFNPYKVRKYHFFLILESSFPSYKAIFSLKERGELLIPPYYDEIEIDIDIDKVVCFEKSIFSIDKNGKITSSSNNQYIKKEYSIKNNKLHLIDSYCKHNNEIYLSDQYGKWAEIYIKCKHNIENCFYRDLIDITNKFYKANSMHYSEDVINSIKQQIEDTKKRRKKEEEILENKKRKEKEQWKLLHSIRESNSNKVIDTDIWTIIRIILIIVSFFILLSNL